MATSGGKTLDTQTKDGCLGANTDGALKKKVELPSRVLSVSDVATFRQEFSHPVTDIRIQPGVWGWVLLWLRVGWTAVSCRPTDDLVVNCMELRECSSVCWIIKIKRFGSFSTVGTSGGGGGGGPVYLQTGNPTVFMLNNKQNKM